MEQSAVEDHRLTLLHGERSHRLLRLGFKLLVIYESAIDLVLSDDQVVLDVLLTVPTSLTEIVLYVNAIVDADRRHIDMHLMLISGCGYEQADSMFHKCHVLAQWQQGDDFTCSRQSHHMMPKHCDRRLAGQLALAKVYDSVQTRMSELDVKW